MHWDRAVVVMWFVWLGTTIGYELWCVLNGSHKTPPLTDVTVQYLPWQIVLPFLVWLLVHFTLHYSKVSPFLKKLLA